MIPDGRWFPALLTTLGSCDRQWAAANLKGLLWAEVETQFLDHFESPVIRDHLLTQLMSVTMNRNETVKQFGDRFTNLMRRTGRLDEDETLIPVLIKGVDMELQNMISISRVTELTAHMGTGNRLTPSAAREIQPAITLDAGRSSNGKRTVKDSATSLPRYGKWGKLGHKTEDHIDNYGPKHGKKPSASAEVKKGAPKHDQT